jgi:tetratricopeptide (TPR) repeat protein
MRFLQAIRLIAMVALLMLPAPFARAQANNDTAEIDRALDLYKHGDRAGALALTEKVLAHSPDNENALYRSALYNFEMNNVEAARGRLERLVKLSGGYFLAWQLMVQVTQAQNDLPRRDDAVDRLKSAIRSAIDPDIRLKTDFIRDRIPIGGEALMGVEYFERGGTDFTRYQFVLGDPLLHPDKGLLLRTDAATTENWADTALMPPDKLLFHLDLVDPKPEGGERVAIYAYFVDEPNYDAVRAKVMEILHGQLRPLSGEPGSLFGVLKKQ